MPVRRVTRLLAHLLTLTVNHKSKHTHPSLFAVSQIHGVALEIHNSDPAMDRSIKIVRTLEQVFEPHRLMFRELKETKQQLQSHCLCREKKSNNK